jgi:hypothetical protein
VNRLHRRQLPIPARPRKAAEVQANKAEEDPTMSLQVSQDLARTKEHQAQDTLAEERPQAAHQAVLAAAQ